MIDTERLRLAPPRVAEAAEAWRMLADPVTARWNPAPGVVDEASAARWCARRADWSGGDHVTLSILGRRSGAYLGDVSLHRICHVQDTAEVGYRVTPAARGHGFAAEALDALVAWGFRELRLVRVQLAHAVANGASCGVARRAGFALEGTLRAAYRYPDGVRYDEHLHARLVDDYSPPATRMFAPVV